MVYVTIACILIENVELRTAAMEMNEEDKSKLVEI